MTLLGTEAANPVGGTTQTPAQRWELVIPHRGSLVRMARRHGAGTDAEDLAQEALLRAASQPGLDPARVHSYLAKVVMNLAIDLHRRAAKEKALLAHASLAPRPRSAEEEVEQVDQRSLAQHAVRLVSGLPARQRDILLLRRDGATWSQVGAKLGEPAATAEMRYRRAVAPLRRQLRTQ